jgi:hypothetical protein
MKRFAFLAVFGSMAWVGFAQGMIAQDGCRCIFAGWFRDGAGSNGDFVIGKDCLAGCVVQLANQQARKGGKPLPKEAQNRERRKGIGMVRPEGVEPPTYWFVASCSIQLSYGRTLQGMQLFKDNGIRGLEQTACV